MAAKPKPVPKPKPRPFLTRAMSALYRFSRMALIGVPLRLAARIRKIEVIQPAHLYPAHISHNRRQNGVLAEFERKAATTGKT